MTKNTIDQQFPPGWDEARVQQVIRHYEQQSEEEALAEDEAHSDPINEFEKIVDNLYGVYLDSTEGFRLVKQQTIDFQNGAISIFKKINPSVANIEYLDSLPFEYGEGHPEDLPLSLHVCTQGERKQRNSKDDDNFLFIGNMCLVSIYQYWEDKYRTDIGNLMKCKTKTLPSDIMGDICKLRNSIIHHRGIAKKEVENCKILKWFKEGDEIFIDYEKMKKIILEIKSQINQWK